MEISKDVDKERGGGGVRGGGVGRPPPPLFGGKCIHFPYKVLGKRSTHSTYAPEMLRCLLSLLKIFKAIFTFKKMKVCQRLI